MKRDWFDSFNDAANGLVRAARTQRNIRIHLLFAALAVAMAVLLRIERTEFVLITLAVGLVLVTELFNSALEGLVDLVAEHYHPLAKAVKDTAAGAVLVAAGVALTCGYLILGPRLAGPTIAVIDRAEGAPEYITGLALIGTTLLVVFGKAVLGKGQPLRGGMPSGHAAVSFAMATALAFLSRDVLIVLLGFGLALMVAQSRMLYRVHSLREVVAGGILGILFTVLLFQILR